MNSVSSEQKFCQWWQVNWISAMQLGTRKSILAVPLYCHLQAINFEPVNGNAKSPV